MSALDLPPSAESVRVARRFVRAELRDSTVDVEVALLLVSEVVTNAVLHARSPLCVMVDSTSPGARIEVRDGSPVPPRLHSFPTTSATGRGLRLLDRLAVAWGVEPNDSGKTIWFDVGEPSDGGWEPFSVDDLIVGGAGGDP